MKSFVVCIIAFMGLTQGVLFAQDISGTWQGTLQDGKPFRIVLKISKAANGGWKAVDYNIDDGAQGYNANTVTLDGTVFKYTISLIGGTYDGKLSADGSSIVGIWAQGAKSLPLTFHRANDETAWEIPKPPRPMDPHASPEFEVATIKQSNPDVPGNWMRINGHQFSTHGDSLNDYIEVAYGVHPRQIVDGPEWMNKDKFDISGVPDRESQPDNDQLKLMIRKLLADRFKLIVHRDKKELFVYALVVGKNGTKLTRSQGDNQKPRGGLRPTPGGVVMVVNNATMADFAAGVFPSVLDRPVVDQTGLSGMFDFELSWAPDES